MREKAREIKSDSKIDLELVAELTEHNTLV